MPLVMVSTGCCLLGVPGAVCVSGSQYFFIAKTLLKKPLHFTLRTLINNYVDQSSRRIFTYSQT